MYFAPFFVFHSGFGFFDGGIVGVVELRLQIRVFTPLQGCFLCGGSPCGSGCDFSGLLSSNVSLGAEA